MWNNSCGKSWNFPWMLFLGHGCTQYSVPFRCLYYYFFIISIWVLFLSTIHFFLSSFSFTMIFTLLIIIFKYICKRTYSVLWFLMKQRPQVHLLSSSPHRIETKGVRQNSAKLFTKPDKIKELMLKMFLHSIQTPPQRCLQPLLGLLNQ